MPQATSALTREQLYAQFLEKVEKAADGCWLWTGTKYSNGYGQFKRQIAHRYSYRYAKGEIPDGLCLDHLCRNKACVNPDHLEPVTQGENLRRAGQGMQTHCPYGHEYTPENTRRSTEGHRHCRACERVRDRTRARQRCLKEKGRLPWPSPAKRTHCIHGHEFTEANTHIDPIRGKRVCRACRREGQRKLKQKRRGAPSQIS